MGGAPFFWGGGLLGLVFLVFTVELISASNLVLGQRRQPALLAPIWRSRPPHRRSASWHKQNHVPKCGACRQAPRPWRPAEDVRRRHSRASRRPRLSPPPPWPEPSAQLALNSFHRRLWK